MSPTRARKLLADGKLPPPDDINPDGEKVWYASTIDRWLRSTGRPVPPGSLWPYSWPDAQRPIEAISTHLRLARDRGAALTAWQLPDGPTVVYIVGYANEDTSDEELAAAAANYLDSPRRPGAVILLPYLLRFGTEPHPHLEIWRIPENGEPGDDQPATTVDADTGLPALLRRLVAHTPKTTPRRVPGQLPARPGVPRWAGSVPAEEVARVLGAPMPLWWDGTNTPEALRTVHLLGRTAPLRVPDLVSDWPPECRRLQAALDHNLLATYPNAFTLLAQYAERVYADVAQAHQYPVTGEGWYVAAMPEPPGWPVVLERRAALAAQRPLDPDAAAEELRGLRREEQDLPWRADDDYGAAVQFACELLESTLRNSHPQVVYARTVCYRWQDATGPVLEEYLRHLTRLPADDLHASPTRPTRRLARLLTEDASSHAIVRHNMLEHARGRLRALYRDPGGRLVAELGSDTSRDTTTLLIEWPVDMPSAGWGPDTVIAADTTISATGVFALTAGPDGTLLPPEPVPNPADMPGFTFGYDGNSPAALYQALVRCALRSWSAAERESWVMRLRDNRTDDPGSTASQLWNQITTSTTLRLSWADIQAWAEADAVRVGHLPR